MKVLVACEFSGIVRDAFLAQNHDAISCDILPTESSGPHYQGDVRDILYKNWDLIVAHPPCTRLCNSGVRWLHERNLWSELDQAAEFFRLFLKHPCFKVAIENPIPHKYAIYRINALYNQKIQPWQFGHPEKKAICLWLKNLPILEPTNIVEPTKQRVWKMSPRVQRQKERSKFFSGIAKAMAKQWGNGPRNIKAIGSRS